jgi:hypothetical protein
MKVLPTAMQFVALMQSIPVRPNEVTVPPEGDAAVTKDSELPFHCSPNKWVCPATPRISHMFVATQETDVREPTVAPEGSGTLVRAQEEPFQTSASVPLDAAVDCPPTARQNEGPTHETLARTSESLTGESAAPLLAVQLVPFHCSMRMPPPMEPAWAPTPVHETEDVHETPSSALPPVSPGAAFAFVQSDALTSGGVVVAPADKPPTVSATSTLAAAIKDVLNRVTAVLLPPSRPLRGVAT